MNPVTAEDDSFIADLLEVASMTSYGAGRTEPLSEDNPLNENECRMRA